MDHRNPLQAAALMAALIGCSVLNSSHAETIAVDGGIAVKESDVVTPSRGMTMEQVISKFGAPAKRSPTVGSPPISRWDYPGFVVYFEQERVIHSVVADS